MTSRRSFQRLKDRLQREGVSCIKRVYFKFHTNLHPKNECFTSVKVNKVKTLRKVLNKVKKHSIK